MFNLNVCMFKYYMLKKKEIINKLTKIVHKIYKQLQKTKKIHLDNQLLKFNNIRKCKSVSCFLLKNVK